MNWCSRLHTQLDYQSHHCLLELIQILVDIVKENRVLLMQTIQHLDKKFVSGTFPIVAESVRILNFKSFSEASECVLSCLSRTSDSILSHNEPLNCLRVGGFQFLVPFELPRPSHESLNFQCIWKICYFCKTILQQLHLLHYCNKFENILELLIVWVQYFVCCPHQVQKFSFFYEMS